MARSRHNVAKPHTWRFSLVNIPGVTGTSPNHSNNMKLNLTRCTTPTISHAEQPIPYAQLQLRVIHDPPEYTPLQIDYIVDEKLENYLKLLAWSQYISDNRCTVSQKPSSAANIHTTGFLEYMDTYDNMLVKFTYYHVLLLSVEALTFDYQQTEEDLIGSFSLVFDHFTAERMGSS